MPAFIIGNIHLVVRDCPGSTLTLVYGEFLFSAHQKKRRCNKKGAAFLFPRQSAANQQGELTGLLFLYRAAAGIDIFCCNKIMFKLSLEKIIFTG